MQPGIRSELLNFSPYFLQTVTFVSDVWAMCLTAATTVANFDFGKKKSNIEYTNFFLVCRGPRCGGWSGSFPFLHHLPRLWLPMSNVFNLNNVRITTLMKVSFISNQCLLSSIVQCSNGSATGWWNSQSGHHIPPQDTSAVSWWSLDSATVHTKLQQTAAERRTDLKFGGNDMIGWSRSWRYLAA